MSDIVPADEIEQIVGATRHSTRHLARAVSAEETVYVLHSHQCRDSRIDLRDCPFHLALDRGIELDVWQGHEDEAVRVTITRSGRLVPVVSGMKVAR